MINNRTHYRKYAIQFWDLDHLFNFGALTVTALKYIGRFEDKNKLEDVEKCIYTLQELQKKLSFYNTNLYRVGFGSSIILVKDFLLQFEYSGSHKGKKFRMNIIHCILNEDLNKALELLTELKKNYAEIYERNNIYS